MPFPNAGTAGQCPASTAHAVHRESRDARCPPHAADVVLRVQKTVSVSDVRVKKTFCTVGLPQLTGNDVVCA